MNFLKSYLGHNTDTCSLKCYTARTKHDLARLCALHVLINDQGSTSKV